MDEASLLAVSACTESDSYSVSPLLKDLVVEQMVLRTENTALSEVT